MYYWFSFASLFLYRYWCLINVLDLVSMLRSKYCLLFCFMIIILVSLFIRSVLLLSMNSESRRLALMEAGSSKILWRILPEQRLICSMVYLRLEISQFVKELTLSFSVVSIFCSWFIILLSRWTGNFRIEMVSNWVLF